MALQPGTRLGPYEIVALLGRGGMGEVYRARDVKLNRDVAIKVLPDHLARDRDRLARLHREAQVLAALNHPHIAHIHGLEDSRGVPALVLELVEGPTLADRIANRPLPVREALEIARQIADALEAAHERNVIHRDLKPANIKISSDGTVKVLDFGLAKAITADAPAPDLSLITAEATNEGIVLGTAAYMSPEQARGHTVDKRTDVWAFGCVLFEMLAGSRPFAGDTVSDTIASILTRDPNWNLLPSGTPAGAARLLRRCLEKDLKHRLRDIGDARIELDETLAAPSRDDRAQQGPQRVTRRTAIGTLTGAAAGAAVTGMFTLGRRRDPIARNVMRFAIALPEGDVANSGFLNRIAISPDGSYVACNVVRRGTNLILGRSLRELEWKPPGEGGFGGSPFFSPDSRWLGMISATDQRMRKVALSGGAPLTICSFPDSLPGGATWAADDTIYFVSATPGGIVRVAGQGGEPKEVAAIDFAKGERLHKSPQALPGGRAIVFAVATNETESFDDASIAVFSPRTGQRKVLVEGGCYPRYSPSGHLVYARNGSLLAVAFDPERLEVTGQPFAVVEGVLMSRNTGVANFDIAMSGDLVYVPGKAEGGARTLYWVDRSGKSDRLPLPARSFLHPRISPDGQRLAIEVEGSRHDVHVYDFASGVLTNITTDGVSHWPIWSPDGRRIGYRSGPMGRFQLWQVPADRSGPAQRVATPAISASAESYHPEGRAIAYTETASGKPVKVTVVSLDGDATPQPLEDTKFAQGSPKFSPDGRWLAYCSNESGRPQVYAKAFPGPGPKVQVSNEGGTDPVWRRDGRELFYRNGDSMMVAGISNAATFAAGRPEELWRGHYSHGMSSSCGTPGLTSSNYDVTPDGRRFLMIRDDDLDTSSASSIVVVLGWAQELSRRNA